MDLVVRAVVAILGMVLVVIFFRSIIRVALTNRPPDDMVLNLAGRLTAVLFIRVPRDEARHHRQDARRPWYWPLSQLVLIGLWLVIVITGFACLYWALGSVRTIDRAFVASGSALSTLGFSTPRDLIGEGLAVVEGLIGLGIVVFVFTFVPGYLSSVQVRDDQVAWVYARTGPDPTGAGILGWLVGAGRGDRLADTWEAWEAWFRRIGETQALSPLLAFDQSVRHGQSWVVASGAMLDATAFATVVLEDGGAADGRACLAAGTHALQMVANALRPAMTRMPAAQAEPELSRADFDALSARLTAAGMRCREDADTAFAALQAARAGYVGLVVRLGRLVSPGHHLLGWSLLDADPDIATAIASVDLTSLD